MPRRAGVLQARFADELQQYPKGKSAMVYYDADEDLSRALGRLVEAVSHSRFWKKTCIFVVEDDPQGGFDHVDGHRSLCLVVSPYTKRREVIHRFYNQTAVLHTMERMLGLPAMNQLDSLAPLMVECFTDTPDFTPTRALPAQVAIDRLNPRVQTLEGKQRAWAEMSSRQDLTRPDRIEDGLFSRIVWQAVKGAEVPYPAEYAGAHGRGLRALQLRLRSSPAPTIGAAR